MDQILFFQQSHRQAVVLETAETPHTRERLADRAVAVVSQAAQAAQELPIKASRVAQVTSILRLLAAAAAAQEKLAIQPLLVAAEMV
jgi:hypothetical protein